MRTQDRKGLRATLMVKNQDIPLHNDNLARKTSTRKLVVAENIIIQIQLIKLVLHWELSLILYYIKQANRYTCWIGLLYFLEVFLGILLRDKNHYSLY